MNMVAPLSRRMKNENFPRLPNGTNYPIAKKDNLEWRMRLKEENVPGKESEGDLRFRSLHRVQLAALVLDVVEPVQHNYFCRHTTHKLVHLKNAECKNKHQ